MCNFKLTLSKIILIFLIAWTVQGNLLLNLPKEFSLRFKASNRLIPSEVYHGTLHKQDLNGKPVITSNINVGNQTFLSYKDGKMSFDKNYKGEEHQECVNEQDVPPIVDILEILKNAQPFHDQSFDKDVNKCKGMKWMIYYGGEPFIICQCPKTLKINHIISESIMIEIENFHNRIVGVLDTKSVDKCKENKKHYEIPKRIPWFLSQETCIKSQIKDDKSCQISSQTFSPGNYTCIFLHGVGHEKTEETLNEYPSYWGQVHLFTPQCSVRKFIRQESTQRGWDNIDLQKSFCELALYGQDKGDKIIKNKLLFVHSMGNMVLSGAIKNGFCDLDPKTTSWYNIMGPLEGSKAAKWLDTICKESGRLNWPYKYIAEQGGYCEPGKNVPYKAYQSLDPNYPGIVDIVKIAKQRVKGALCGSSSYGLQTRYGIGLYMLSLMVGFGEDSDGMVGFSSCNLGLKDQFQKDYQNNYYLANLNHADGTSRNGNGWWGVDRKPLDWFSLRK